MFSLLEDCFSAMYYWYVNLLWRTLHCKWPHSLVLLPAVGALWQATFWVAATQAKYSWDECHNVTFMSPNWRPCQVLCTVIYLLQSVKVYHLCLITCYRKLINKVSLPPFCLCRLAGSQLTMWRHHCDEVVGSIRVFGNMLPLCSKLGERIPYGTLSTLLYLWRCRRCFT